MWPVTGPGVIGLAVIFAIFTCVAMLLIRVFAQRGRWRLMIAIPLAWVSVEAFRGAWPFGGLSWFTLAHSQSVWESGESFRLIQIADLIGQHTVGLLVALVNGYLADVVLGGRRHQIRRGVGLVVVLIAVQIYGAWRIGQLTDASTEGPVVAVVQTNVPQDNKNSPSPESIRRDFENLMVLHQQAAEFGAAGETPSRGVDLIVWPETVILGPLNPSGAGVYRAAGQDENLAPRQQSIFALLGSFSEVVPQLIRRVGVPTLVGAGTEVFGEQRQRFNSVYFYDGLGEMSSDVYHKHHLVPFGEYIPGPNWTDALFVKLFPIAPHPDLGRGAGPVVFNLDLNRQSDETFRFATPICFEDTVGSVCRDMVYGPSGKQVDALINLTNDGWFAGQSQRRQHTQLASLRSIENRVPMVRSVNTGVSGFIDSNGRPGPLLKSNSDGRVAEQLKLDPRTSLYGIVGGWPIGLLSMATFLAAAWLIVFGKARRRV